MLVSGTSTCDYIQGNRVPFFQTSHLPHIFFDEIRIASRLTMFMFSSYLEEVIRRFLGWGSINDSHLKKLFTVILERNMKDLVSKPAHLYF